MNYGVEKLWAVHRDSQRAIRRRSCRQFQGAVSGSRMLSCPDSDGDHCPLGVREDLASAEGPANGNVSRRATRSPNATLGEFALAMDFRFEGGSDPWEMLRRQVARVSTRVPVGTPDSPVSGVWRRSYRILGDADPIRSAG